ncbi:uncharacterized protein LOC111693943 [Trichogramma pretiosum]|uniref:uncharacterized protein LOC111693943 n=1 Tax=Trichogramma pretiosum TaxID=7493 RepID=UPI000C71C535|nr:uncharacterized protein LOC111693943 [Trichogramma pretiosum]
MRPESQGNNSMLGEDAAKVTPLDLSDGNNNAQQELASQAATAGSASIASEISPFIPTAASLIAPPMLDSSLQQAMNMAGPSSASSSPMRDSSNSSLDDSMTHRTSKVTGTMKQRRKAKGKTSFSPANRASASNKRLAKPLLPEDKLKAIECVLIHGQTKASVARNYRVPESTLRGWCKTHAASTEQKNSKPQREDESSASSARSESPMNNPLTYPVASLAANTCTVPNERRQHNDSDADAQFENNLAAINPVIMQNYQNYLKTPAGALNPEAATQFLKVYSKIASALPFVTGTAGLSQMALSLAQNNSLFVPDGLQNAKSNVINNNSAAQTSQANFSSTSEVYKTYFNAVRESALKSANQQNANAFFLTNQALNKNNSTNDHKSQHTIAWISQQAQIRKIVEQEQAHAQAQAQAKLQPLQKQLHQQQSQQQAANLLNGGTFSNVNSTAGWSPLVSATSAVNSTSSVTSTVTSQNCNNKPSRGIKSISDNPLLLSQTSTNHDLEGCLNLIKKEKEVSNNQTNGSTMTEEDMKAGVATGEKFMQFLEECKDPSVTQVQLNLIRTVLKNLKVKGRKSPTPKRCRKQATHMTQKM